MGRERNQREGPENQTNSDTDAKKFNAGSNSSDYDGGQPQDSIPDSEGQVDEKQKSETKQLPGKEFNAGGNDSDYDGGHPKGIRKDSQGRINEKE